MGITLKPSKSSFCMNRIKWFGRVFNSNGVTADPDKISNITSSGKPTNLEDARSLLMACQFNAKFIFGTKDKRSYEEITAPLRPYNTINYGKKSLRYTGVINWNSFLRDLPNDFVLSISHFKTYYKKRCISNYESLN